MRQGLRGWCIRLVAAVMLVTGVHACGGGSQAVFIPYFALGMFDGPAKSGMSTIFSIACLHSFVDCNGEVRSSEAGDESSPFTTGFDDDFWSLIRGVIYLFDVGAVEQLEDEFLGLVQEEVNDLGGPEIGDMIYAGPSQGFVDFSDSCRIGSGTLVVTRAEEREFIDDPEASLGAARGVIDERTYYLRDSILELDNCRVEGRLDDETGDDSVTVTGSMRLTVEIGEDVGSLVRYVGSFVINPGQYEGQLDGVDFDAFMSEEFDLSALPVWGFSELVTINIEEFDPPGTVGFQYEGGVCYGGAIADEELCDGIFVPAFDFFVDTGVEL